MAWSAHRAEPYPGSALSALGPAPLALHDGRATDDLTCVFDSRRHVFGAPCISWEGSERQRRVTTDDDLRTPNHALRMCDTVFDFFLYPSPNKIQVEMSEVENELDFDCFKALFRLAAANVSVSRGRAVTGIRTNSERRRSMDGELLTDLSRGRGGASGEAKSDLITNILFYMLRMILLRIYQQ